MSDNDRNKSSPLDTFAEDLGRAVLVAAAASGESNRLSLAALAAGSSLSPDQLTALIEQTRRLRDCVNGYLLYLTGVLSFVSPARNEEQGRPPSSLRQGHDDGDEDPAYDAAHVDQGTDVRSPTAATTVVRTDQGRSVRGASGPGARVSSGAGPSSGPVRGKRKGGPPSAAAAHGAGNEAKRQRTDDLWLKKWGCTQSELTRRRKEKVCLRCAGGHPTRDCPMLPPLAQQPK
ncbi:hypothetical protein Vafri_12727 [Volvox africanus]|uniref:Uncharacterized protein n=1 Tax=Volvox africanus TaxID=51714 RepID=A0A8J4BFD4_9CHLO|nr:hypothetical protein Vafri_12727 [Volvox africanus]